MPTTPEPELCDTATCGHTVCALCGIGHDTEVVTGELCWYCALEGERHGFDPKPRMEAALPVVVNAVGTAMAKQGWPNPPWRVVKSRAVAMVRREFAPEIDYWRHLHRKARNVEEMLGWAKK